MVGFVQLFFITILLFYQPEAADSFHLPTIADTDAMARPSDSKWTNETVGSENARKQNNRK
jgi:hypothetical protein